MSGRPVSSTQDFSLSQNGATHAGTQRQHQNILAATRRAPQPFRDHRRARIVVGVHRFSSRARAHHLAQGVSFELLQVARRKHHFSGFGIDHAFATDSDGLNFAIGSEFLQERTDDRLEIRRISARAR